MEADDRFLAAALISEKRSVGFEKMRPGLVDKVLEVCDARLLVEPYQALLWARRSWALNAQRRPLEALGDAQRALQLLKEQRFRGASEEESEETLLEARIQANVGFAMLQLGEFEEAMRCYEAAATKGADADLCSRMRERCLEYSVSAGLAQVAQPSPRPRVNLTVATTNLSDTEAEDAARAASSRSTPLATKPADDDEAQATSISEECQLLMTLHQANKGARLVGNLTGPQTATARPPSRPLAEEAAAKARSPTGVDESPCGVEDGRPYKPYSMLFHEGNKIMCPPNQPNNKRALNAQPHFLDPKRPKVGLQAA